MTTKYLELRNSGKDSHESMKETLDACVSSVFVSGMCFFAATFGVGIYTDIDLIGSICTLISRGAIISMLVVILILPSLLMIFDKLIMKTTYKGKKELKMKKKVLAGLLITSMLPLTVFGATKDETVYSRLSSDGSVSKTIVSNHLSNLNKGNYNDKTNLKNIINVNGDEKYNLTNNNLVWNTDGKDIFYKGTSEKALPIETTIKYYLNGKEISNKELNGKSGNIKIVIKYKNNSSSKEYINGKKTTLYTPFLVTSFMTLDKENISDLKVENAKIIDNGINYMIAGYSVPGLYESLKIDELKGMDTITIEYKTTSYKFASVYMAASSNLFDEDNNSLSELNKIYSSVNKLSDSTNKLVNGSKDLKDNLAKYSEKYNEFNNGLKTLNSKTEYMMESYSKINAGVQNLNKNVEDLSKYTSSIKNLAVGINTLSDKTAAIANSSEKLTSSINDSITAITKHIEVLTKIKETTTDEETKKMLEEEIISLQKSIDVKTLSTASNTISSLNKGISGVNKNMSALAVASEPLSKEIDKLSPSVNYLATSSEKFNEGVSELNTSVKYINTVSNEFNTSSKLLLEGATSLNDGLNKFNKEGISKITNIVNGKLKTTSKKVEKLIDLGNSYNSFGSKNNNTEGTTKFIMIVSE